jgi:homoserine dehydrogenase
VTKNEPLRLLLIGFGNVGCQFARILTVEREQFPGLDDLNVTVVGITTLSRGSLENPEGIDLRRALLEIETAGRFQAQNPDFSSRGSADAASELEYDVLVELSTLSIDRRGEPACSYVRTALGRGRHVVTANKGPIAFAYNELRALARAHNCILLHESVVMDGAPVFDLAHFGMRGCRVLEVDGILNSTSNFVLSRMELGEHPDDAVRIAQARGFAEADPRHDLEGWDSAAKICVLANVLLDGDLTPLEVEREGILALSAKELRTARQEKKRVKLVCRAWREDGQVRAAVKLKKLSDSHPFSRIKESGGILRIATDLMGPIIVQQEAPTLYDTAYGVLNDLLLLGIKTRPSAEATPN